MKWKYYFSYCFFFVALEFGEKALKRANGETEIQQKRKKKGTNLRMRTRSANLLCAMCEYTFCQNPQQTYRMTQEILVGVLTKDEEWNEQNVFSTINHQRDRTIEMKFKPQKNKRNHICRDLLHCNSNKVLNVGKIIKNGCRFEKNFNICIVFCSLNANFACFLLIHCFRNAIRNPSKSYLVIIY